MANDVKVKKSSWMLELMIATVVAVAVFFFIAQDDALERVYAVMDQGAVIDERISKGDSAVEALVYYNTLIKVYAHKGVVVHTKDSMVTYPESMNAVLPEKKALFKMAIEYGFPVNDDDYTSAQIELDRQMQKIRTMILKN
jgi:hypothetical protein